MTRTAEEIVQQFWTLMKTNDFDSVAAVLAPDFVLEWPQSGERIRGAARFARMNAEYPAHGQWQFTVHRIVGNDREAASEVSVTDGVQHAKALSFFEISAGKVSRIVEYWPEPYDPPPGRAHLVERMA
jgi:ketosteroid isomerase-like protein